MSWRWRPEVVDGDQAADDALPGTFPSQSDAETWLGESWRELREKGVVAVTLYEEGRKVYGPMPLADS